MTVEELRKLRYFKEQVTAKEYRIKELTELLERITVDTTKEPVQSSSDKQEVIANLMDIKKQYLDCVNDLYQKRRVAEEQIYKMKDILNADSIEKQKILLELRYLSCLTMEEIAVIMGITFQWTFVLRSRAEKNFERFDKKI